MQCNEFFLLHQDYQEKCSVFPQCERVTPQENHAGKERRNKEIKRQKDLLENWTVRLGWKKRTLLDSIRNRSAFQRLPKPNPKLSSKAHYYFCRLCVRKLNHSPFPPRTIFITKSSLSSLQHVVCCVQYMQVFYRRQRYVGGCVY